MGAETISGRSFRPADLAIAARRPGVSGYLRTRNGADFIVPTIESHLPFFDEIVVLHNQCTDATPDLLERLAVRHGPRLRVYHYVDRVFPPGSEAHARLPADHPSSFVNYTNVALSLTSHRIATKIDDDHLAIPEAMGPLVDCLRKEGAGGRLHCFSGLNLMRDGSGGVGINNKVPFSGVGDIGFFEVTARTFYHHDRRFETFDRDGAQRVFAGLVYWHLKYLKTGNGFGNYDLAENPHSRYFRQLRRYLQSRPIGIGDLRLKLARGDLKRRLMALVSQRQALAQGQFDAIAAGEPHESAEAAMERLALLSA